MIKVPRAEVKLDVTDIENFRYDADRCVGCKGCAWVDHIYMDSVRFGQRCPSVMRYAFDSYGAYGRLKIILGLVDGELAYSDRLLDVIYKCTLCGACDAGCKRNLDLEPLLALEAIRVKCVQDGKGPLPPHKRITENIERAHNRYGSPHENRLNWLPREVKIATKADILYFAGCASSYLYPEISQAVVKILNATNTNFMVIPDEWCCGNVLYTTGQIEAAKKQAQHNIETIQRSGASTVLVSCAECYKTLKVDYPKIFNKSTADMGFKVTHFAELIAQQLKDGALKFSKRIEMRATYHDSCNLARLSEPWIYWEGKRERWGTLTPPKQYRRGTYGVYEPPREILRNIPGLELVEMIRMRENTLCCGAGAGVREAFKDFSLWTAGERLEEVKAIGAEAIISTCPRCKENFTEAVNTRGEKTKVYDISELILNAI